MNKSSIYKSFILFSFFLGSFFANAQTDKGTTINILSWNIYMRPRVAFHDGQIKRAHEIVKQMTDKNYDVIVFQEAFDNKARNIIWNGLKEKYPYQSGAPKHKYFFKVSTGVFIISKLPLEMIDHIYFSECGGSDCFAVKGAALVKIIKNGKAFQIIGTHLQAANGKKKTGSEIRKIQYDEINSKLLVPHQKTGIPQFLVGDLNTKKSNEAAYENLIKDLNMEDGDISGTKQYSSDGTTNDFKDADSQPKLIDYILCKKNGANVNFTKRTIEIFKSNWSKEHKDLSDHYAVLAEIVIE
ncbi:MAG: sphingomyelin phosphodiesterase [Bacteroidia bacterium]